ncbi:alanine acetyltransferase [Phytomonospora endophytica]|nr:alanine acetyltransferase [Phytomonospora endophytica]
MVTTTRPIAPGDAPAVAALLKANRGFLAPWQPRRPDDYFTVEHQSGLIDADLTNHELGNSAHHVILDDGEIAGLIKLSGIVRGAFQSCSVGYWVDGHRNGRGLASAAVAAMVRVAFDEFGLHRVQAEILEHNTGSRRVLERNGFIRYGFAPDYLHIDGRWQDHILYQALNADWKG